MIVRPLFLLVAGVAAEGACGGELSELVTYHVLSYIYGNELVSVVHCESMAYEFRSDHGCAAPRLDDVLLAGSFHVGYFLLKLDADEGTFF